MNDGAAPLRPAKVGGQVLADDSLQKAFHPKEGNRHVGQPHKENGPEHGSDQIGVDIADALAVLA